MLPDEAASEVRALSTGEALFRQGDPTRGLFRVGAETAAIGRTQAKLRYTHLTYHPSASDALEPAQVAMYNALRGYDVRQR
jgi:hypothetical protein